VIVLSLVSVLIVVDQTISWELHFSGLLHSK